MTPQVGQTKPPGQCAATRACSQCSAVPQRLLNSGNYNSFWSWTRFIGKAHHLVGCAHPRRSAAHSVSLLSFIANKEGTRPLHSAHAELGSLRRNAVKRVPKEEAATDPR